MDVDKRFTGINLRTVNPEKLEETSPHWYIKKGGTAIISKKGKHCYDIELLGFVTGKTDIAVFKTGQGYVALSSHNTREYNIVR